ncbi:MAG: hypothetical protein ACLQDV_17135 [Candidatus Binataceae bacterium]
MKRLLVFVPVVVLAVLASGVLLAQSNPFIGAWKLNTAKSKYGLAPGPQNLTLTYEAQGNGVKVSSEGTAADGSSTAWSYTADYDGKDNPVSGTGVPNGADTIALKRINPNTTRSIWKKAGAVVRTARSVVSKDGKVMTIFARATNASGQPGSNVLVFDKQ